MSVVVTSLENDQWVSRKFEGDFSVNHEGGALVVSDREGDVEAIFAPGYWSIVRVSKSVDYLSISGQKTYPTL